jgi:hypothetical protein
MGLGVEVRKGMRVAGRGVESIPEEAQEDRRKRQEERYRQA